MENLPLGPSDLQRYQRSVALLREVVEQINKDFQLQGFDVEFSGSGETAYQELTHQLMPVISYMLENQTARFWNLVYRIDLSENKVRHILFGNSHIPDPIHELTDLILKRELQKVVIRHIYSGRELP